MPSDMTPEACGHRVQAFIREHKSGGCRMFSEGSNCGCPLCDVMRLMQTIEQQAAELARLRKANDDDAELPGVRCACVFDADNGKTLQECVPHKQQRERITALEAENARLKSEEPIAELLQWAIDARDSWCNKNADRFWQMQQVVERISKLTPPAESQDQRRGVEDVS